ncbi:3-deoxy-D-manno-octulosonic acid transferase [Cryomorpha ignava]|uniref:3-deoxy-D-manno-octulosonic acid transferase n=1 Tax=Cryomorpha ignava TaxID=101383 RepID=A0A7K3WV52_9FLAO|nr:glycosyltransferase N-terminal domain-containing protein [Cryomorpha ignava]NEN25530.1 3-deoxy-D-manno-octulosonic acid transferase [Cryomorpha ignava]
MRFFYTLGIRIYGLGIRMAALGNPKAGQWVSGRKKWKQELSSAQALKGCIWFHCASLGEFEQGRSLLEKLKRTYPSKPILLTFFSPSGYLIRKNYDQADHIAYLPLDTPKNARIFLDKVKPDLAIFVKYEVWPNFFAAIAKRNIPLLMISAIFSENQIYFKPYGKWFRKSLKQTHEIFTQDVESINLLNSIGVVNTRIAGDTRFDRVIEIAKKTPDFPELEQFTRNKPTIVAGSTWPADEELLAKYAQKHPEVRFIIAPHETYSDHIKTILQKFPEAVRWSEKERIGTGNTVIIDSIGLLSAIYKYGSIAYVGGGFGSGIHNTLEPAVYGMPVIFGPEYKNFREAIALSDVGAGKSIKNYKELENFLNELLESKELLAKMSSIAAQFVKENAGATDIILEEIKKILN